MLSAEDFAAIKISIELCTASALKGKIISILEADEYITDKWNVIVKWHENTQRSISVLLESLGLGKCLQEKVTNFVILIGIMVLSWARYHEHIIGFSNDFSINFLKSSHFTWRGVINYAKTAEGLMKFPKLNIQQKYKMACHYCFVDQISVLFKQMSLEERKEFCGAQDPDKTGLPDLVMFWSDFVTDQIDNFGGEQSVDEYTDRAIISGGKAYVEYCLEKIGLNHKESTTEISKDVQLPLPYNGYSYLGFISSLFNKMNKTQLTEFFRKTHKGNNFHQFGILSYFLLWPYQNYFLKAVNLTWDFLPERYFADLLASISYKIECGIEVFYYGDGEVFNYRKLLNEFWCDAPLRFKRFLFRNDDSLNSVIKGIFLKNSFTNEDRMIVEMILESATKEEKRNIFYSEIGVDMCTRLIKLQKWKRFDIFVSNFFQSTEQVNKFKKEFIFTKGAQAICNKFIKDQKWEEAESFIKWTTFTEEEIIQLKREMMLSNDGKQLFRNFIVKNSLNTANKFCEWFFSSGSELKKFKRDFIFSEFGFKICMALFENKTLENVDEFVSDFLFFSVEDITKFKANFTSSEYGSEICEDLILNGLSNSTLAISSDSNKETDSKIIKWEQVDMFLNWGFSTKEEINYFKREKIYKELGKDILFEIIEDGYLDEAETFFSWLDLSFDEIKGLKRDMVFYNMSDIYRSVALFYLKSFLNWEGNKMKNAERFLKWLLTDKKAVLDFKDKFDEECEIQRRRIGESFGEDLKTLNKFYKFIAKLRRTLR